MYLNVSGNICRSPIAEAVFAHFVTEAGLTDKVSNIPKGVFFNIYPIFSCMHDGCRIIVQSFKELSEHQLHFLLLILWAFM